MAAAGGRCQAGFMPPERLEVPNASSPIPGVSEGRRQPRISRVVAVILVVASEVGAVVVLLIGIFVGLCALFGEDCSSGEDMIVTIAPIGTLILGFGGPFMVAWLRRNAVWALTPFVISGLIWGYSAIM